MRVIILFVLASLHLLMNEDVMAQAGTKLKMHSTLDYPYVDRLKGKHVIIDLFDSRCKVCFYMLPKVNELQRQFIAMICAQHLLQVVEVAGVADHGIRIADPVFPTYAHAAAGTEVPHQESIHVESIIALIQSRNKTSRRQVAFCVGVVKTLVLQII